jgi:hypothetical protein
VLKKLIKEKKAKMLGNDELDSFRDPAYIYVLLGAFAMTLGCQFPDFYASILKKVYKEAGLMPDAVRQMK